MLVKTNSQLPVQAMAVGKKAKMHFRPVAVADPLDEPLFNDGWWFVPESQDKSVIPLEAKRGVKVLQTAGIPVMQTIVAHEAPQLLTAPVIVKSKRDRQKVKEAVKLVGLLGAATVAVSGVVITLLSVLGLMFVSAVMVDPAYIAVCRDEHGNYFWIEVATWLD